MKQAVIVLLSLGLVGAFANTIQQSDNDTPLPEPSDSDAKHEVEDTLNKAEQKEPVVSIVDTGLVDDENAVSITIEENLVPVDDFNAQPDVFSEIPEYPSEETNLYRTLSDGYDDEIMDVAASWVPPPFFRRQKQKARRRFSAPRHFVRPYRRFHYYPYHSFYPRPYFY